MALPVWQSLTIRQSIAHCNLRNSVSKRRPGARIVYTELRQFGVIDCEPEGFRCCRIRFVRLPEDLPIGLHWNFGPEKPLGPVPDFHPRSANAVNVGNTVYDVHTIRGISKVDFRINCRATGCRGLPD